MSTIRKIKKPSSFALKEWYSSDEAKRNFGSICQHVNNQGKIIGLLGTKDNPYLFLEDIDIAELGDRYKIISIENAKADWNAITLASMLNNVRFQVHGKKIPRVLMYRNENFLHPALNYGSNSSSDINKVTAMLEAVLAELNSITVRLENSAELIVRRFKEAWRASNGLIDSAQHTAQ